MDAEPDRIAGALVRPYLDLPAVPRPRPAEPVENEFAELADRIRTYLAIRN
ncbi:hypothetical protein [Nocardiopsis sp. NPDC057823]|uniref:hypothetical protein n=1 Tax=Nocardiopsis sp. NPDC057823 TaxID=3346256 RepID=UPI00366EDD3C